MCKYVIPSAALSAFIGVCLVISFARPAEAAQRSFTIVAVEPKGGATVDKEPFPTTSLPNGNGYVLKAPDSTGRWEVSAYVWQPNQIIVDEGDEVTLEFVGINGAEHPTEIEGYNKNIVLKRGNVVRIQFIADKAGVFKIKCHTHGPSMIGELVVVAKKQFSTTK